MSMKCGIYLIVSSRLYQKQYDMAEGAFEQPFCVGGGRLRHMDAED